MDSAIAIIEKELGIARGGGNLYIKTPLETVVITPDNLVHFVEKRDNARERYAKYILPTLQRPVEIWGTAYDDGSTRNRYIGIFTGKTDVAIIVKVEPDGSIILEKAFEHGLTG